MTQEAKKMLDTWKQSYLDVRKKIEESGREARWEFDQRALFEGTTYMAFICDGLNNSAQVYMIILKFLILNPFRNGSVCMHGHGHVI